VELLSQPPSYFVIIIKTASTQSAYTLLPLYTSGYESFSNSDSLGLIVAPGSIVYTSLSIAHPAKNSFLV